MCLLSGEKCQRKVSQGKVRREKLYKKVGEKIRGKLSGEKRGSKNIGEGLELGREGSRGQMRVVADGSGGKNRG